MPGEPTGMPGTEMPRDVGALGEQPADVLGRHVTLR